MQSRLLGEGEGGRLFALVLATGEEAFATIRDFAARERITAASLTAIGAFSRTTVGWYDFGKKDYTRIVLDEQCEVLSALGDIAVDDDGEASLHMHAVLGLEDGSTRGGHLLEGITHPTLEVMITETPAHLRRRARPGLGISLLDLDAG